jgi:hypothetical protein
MKTTSRLGVVMAAMVVAAGATVLGVPPPVSPAGAQECDGGTDSDDSGTTVEVDCNGPGDRTGGTPGSPGDPGSSGGGGLDPAAVCAASYPSWADCVDVVSLNGVHPDQICGYVVAPWQDQLEYYEPDAPDNATLLYFVCPRDGVFYTEDTQWSVGAVLPQPPSPEEVAADWWTSVQADLVAPELTSSPAPGDPAIVRVPTFVEVDNWQGEITDEACQVGVCVELVATPTLTFDPGEPEAEVIECDPPGTRFDRDGAPAEDQAAADGACAHAYQFRTGFGSRPDEWPGVVSVEWETSWQGAGESGTFDPIVLSSDLPRQVDEVRGLVTEMEVRG